jgi:hypothetical protein
MIEDLNFGHSEDVSICPRKDMNAVVKEEENA